MGNTPHPSPSSQDGCWCPLVAISDGYVFMLSNAFCPGSGEETPSLSKGQCVQMGMVRPGPLRSLNLDLSFETPRLPTTSLV